MNLHCFPCFLKFQYHIAWMKSFSKFADINFAFCFFGILRLKEQIEEMLDHIKTGLGLKLQGGNFFFFFFFVSSKILKSIS